MYVYTFDDLHGLVLGSSKPSVQAAAKPVGDNVPGIIGTGQDLMTRWATLNFLGGSFLDQFLRLESHKQLEHPWKMNN
jgi:hypothetical protein